VSASASCTILLNGAPLELEAGTTVSALVAVAAESPKGIAVAVNADVVPRSAWDRTVVAAGDRVELLTAAQGG
jgi:sulfur carrier protein